MKSGPTDRRVKVVTLTLKVGGKKLRIIHLHAMGNNQVKMNFVQLCKRSWDINLKSQSCDLDL